MDYFEKIESNPYKDLIWNLPEQKQGLVNVVGGSAGSFRSEVKIAEYLTEKYPVHEVRVIMPDSLKNKLPGLPFFHFLTSTESGSFAESQELVNVFDRADFNLMLGDLSKNKVIGKAISDSLKTTSRETLITRDTIDLINDNNPERILMNEQIILMASLSQLQKLLRAIYYPKMILMSQSLVQVAEILHKFTLSYPIKIVSLHDGQILVAKNGLVKAVPLEKSGYSPILLWSGELAAKIVAINLYNPNDFIGATICAIFD